jgi:4a-hydroxytetrahydrobiopterin dehydratase
MIGRDRLADPGGSMATLLDPSQLSAALADLPDWHGDGGSISRTAHLDDDRVEGFLADLETVAREMNHDPVIERSGSDMTITMSTHSAGGVTDLDVTYAHRVDDLLGAVG